MKITEQEIKENMDFMSNPEFSKANGLLEKLYNAYCVDVNIWFEPNKPISELSNLWNQVKEFLKK